MLKSAKNNIKLMRWVLREAELQRRFFKWKFYWLTMLLREWGAKECR